MSGPIRHVIPFKIDIPSFYDIFATIIRISVAKDSSERRKTWNTCKWKVARYVEVRVNEAKRNNAMCAPSLSNNIVNAIGVPSAFSNSMPFKIRHSEGLARTETPR